MACREGGVAHLQLALGVGLQQSLGRIKGSLVAEGDVVDAPLRHVPGGDIHLGLSQRSELWVHMFSIFKGPQKDGNMFSRMLWMIFTS